MVQLDPNNEFHARAIERLTSEEVIWLVTTAADGTPQPNPVWFVWDGDETVTIYSQSNHKVNHVEARPRVALHFNDENGGNVVIFTGTATVTRGSTTLLGNAAYRAKYDEPARRIGYAPEQFADSYNNEITITLEKIRGF